MPAYQPALTEPPPTNYPLRRPIQIDVIPNPPPRRRPTRPCSLARPRPLLARPHSCAAAPPSPPAPTAAPARRPPAPRPRCRPAPAASTSSSSAPRRCPTPAPGARRHDLVSGAAPPYAALHRPRAPPPPPTRPRVDPRPALTCVLRRGSPSTSPARRSATPTCWRSGHTTWGQKGRSCSSSITCPRAASPPCTVRPHIPAMLFFALVLSRITKF